LKSRRIFAIAKKDLKKMRREPATLFLLVLFPMILTLVFGLCFGAVGGSQSPTYQTAVVNMDTTSSSEQWSQNFIGNLSNTGVLKVQIASDNSSAQADLAQGKIQAILVIPVGFGESCESFMRAPTNASKWVNSTIEMYLDAGSPFAAQTILPIVQQVLAITLYGVHTVSVSQPIGIASPSLIQSSHLTMFDIMAPGLFAYAAIFLTMTVAQSFAVEREQGLLRRISTTPTSSSEFIVGETTSNMLAAVVQVALIFAMTFLVGFHPLGGAAALVAAFAIMVIFSLCNVGFGLITATIAKSPGAATGLAFIFIMPQMFLGTFISGMMPAAEAAGVFVPSHYATDALTSLFSRGAPVFSPTVLFDIGILSVASMGILLFGIALFKRFGKAW
jgi:ABC-type multidrug transport system permease subunit